MKRYVIEKLEAVLAMVSIVILLVLTPVAWTLNKMVETLKRFKG